MTLIPSESAVRQELATLEGYLAQLTEHMARIEGRRDQLLSALLDTDGLHAMQVEQVGHTAGPIACRHPLGGMLKFYYRGAA